MRYNRPGPGRRMKRRLPNLLTAAALVLAAYVLCPAAILAMRANLLAGAAGAVALLAAALLYRSLADRREAARWHRLINGLCVH
jgi:hypothetical protein